MSHIGHYNCLKFKLTPPVIQGDIQKGLKLLEELFFSSQEICDQDCLLHLSVG